MKKTKKSDELRRGFRRIVVISGDRQAGKTHAALAVAAADAMTGRTVHYESVGLDCSANVREDIAAFYLQPEHITKVLRSTGRQRITLVNGGEIHFTSAAQKNNVRGIKNSTDTFIFDDTPLPYGFARDNPDAYIYVTVIPPGGDV